MGAEDQHLARRFLAERRRGADATHIHTLDAPEWQPVRGLLEDLSPDRGSQGLSRSGGAALDRTGPPPNAPRHTFPVSTFGFGGVDQRSASLIQRSRVGSGRQ